MANTYAASSGTKLYYGTTTGTPDTQLAGIKAFGALPKQETDEFEITRVDQMDGDEHDWFKQFAPDHIDPGTLELTLGLSETQLETLYDLVRDMRTWKIQFTSGGDLQFDGFIKTVGPEVEDKGEVIVTVAMRCSGKPTFTKAT